MKYTEYIEKSFEKLTVLSLDYVDNIGRAYFKCQCKCGNETLVIGGNLISGNTSSCGRCIERELINKKFGKLTVIEFHHRDRNRGTVYVKCSCKCGNETIVKAAYLLDGRTYSCGRCQERELIGKKFGKVTIIKFDHRDGHRSAYFKCCCECGNKTIIRGTLLIDNHIQQCLSCARKQKVSKSATLTLDLLEKKLQRSIKRKERISKDHLFTTDGTVKYKGRIFQIEIDGVHWHRYSGKEDAKKEKLVLKNGHIPIRVECNNVKESAEAAEDLYNQIIKKTQK